MMSKRKNIHPFVKFLAYIIIPILFAFLGGFAYQGIKKIPHNEWDKAWGSNFASYGLDSKPVSVLEAGYSYRYLLLTEKGTVFECYFEVKRCSIKETHVEEDRWGISGAGDVADFDVPEFERGVRDILRVDSISLGQIDSNYYLTADDGSVWQWGEMDSFYKGILWTFISGVIGFVLGVLAVYVGLKRISG